MTPKEVEEYERLQEAIYLLGWAMRYTLLSVAFSVMGLYLLFTLHNWVPFYIVCQIAAWVSFLVGRHYGEKGKKLGGKSK